MIFKSFSGHLKKYLANRYSEVFLFSALVTLLLVSVWSHQRQTEVAHFSSPQITEIAVKSAVAVVNEQPHQRKVDLQVVFDWQRAREAYRDAQRQLIDTTFLDYFNLPVIEDTEEIRDEPPPLPSPPTPAVAGVATERLDVLTRGMWQSYCRASADDTTVDCSTQHTP